MRVLVFAILLSMIAPVSAQKKDIAQEIYDSSHDSVFLVYVNDSKGTPQALGSAFLVAPRTLITNAHVVEGGNAVLSIGPIRVPLKVVRIDPVNDLALLSVDADLTSRPLPLASTKVSPGQQIFAIGNPEGLEKTISQGIVSGLRKIQNKNLIQITSPISHGSSGGPILNSSGEVVAVAVAILEDGENLNFAVPVEYVRRLLEGKNTPPLGTQSLSENLEMAKDLILKRDKETYSSDQNSEYQRESSQLVSMVKNITAESNDRKDLSEIACMGVNQFDLSDEGMAAARKLVQNNPSPESSALFAYELFQRAQTEDMIAIFAEKNSGAKRQAVIAKANFLLEAQREATRITHPSKGENLLLATFVLGGVAEDDEDFTKAIQLHSVIANSNLEVCGNDLKLQAYRDLIYESVKVNHPTETEKWFTALATAYEPAPYEWDSEGDRRSAASDYKNAAEAYEKAATASSSYNYDFCFAAGGRAQMGEDDSVLADGRKCIDASVGKVSTENQKYFDKQVPFIYRLMASILDQRGSYQQAMEYIKESLNSKPDDPFALNAEASIFEHLDKPSECISAEKAAIRASDGKYSWMQFQLGNCYFDAENWSQAAASFRIEAEADKTDAAAAFDLGLSLSRQGYRSDASQWYSEALKRNPKDELKQKILHALQ